MKQFNYLKKLIIVVSSFIVIALDLSHKKPPTESPLFGYDFTDCQICVYDYGGNNIICYLSEEQRDEFMDIMMNVKLNFNPSKKYRQYLGRYKQYKIITVSGDCFDIASVGPYLVIDENGYASDYKSISGLCKYYEDVFRTYYSSSYQ